MTELANHKNDAHSTVLSDFNTLQHDSAGNHLGMVSNLPAASAYSGTSTFSHNSVSQILQETSSRAGGYTNTFAYDNAFNATTFRGATPTYNTANELNGVIYDGDGNPTAWNSNALTFDTNCQLTAIGTILSAGYDSSGRRAWKQNANGRTYFLYDMEGTVPLCELNSNGSVTAYNTYAADGLLARHVNGASSVFYTFDPQGNTSQRLDTNGNILSSSTYDAFGVLVTNATTSDPYNGLGAQFGYYRDNETGLSLLGFRYYDSGNGRFLNRDPMEDGDNWYAYCSNSPLINQDPTGLWQLQPWCFRRVIYWIGVGICIGVAGSAPWPIGFIGGVGTFLWGAGGDTGLCPPPTPPPPGDRNGGTPQGPGIPGGQGGTGTPGKPGTPGSSGSGGNTYINCGNTTIINLPPGTCMDSGRDGVIHIHPCPPAHGRRGGCGK